jgi:hypothetical protein
METYFPIEIQGHVYLDTASVFLLANIFTHIEH